MTQETLNLLFNPGSVAVLGASDDPHRIGGRTIWQALRHGYSDIIYPVNPRRETVQGLTCYPSIGAIGKPVDCAIVSVPATAVAGSLRECAAAGVRTAIVFSSGFAELGDDGRRAQAELTEIARSTGMRIVGPNCIGWIDTIAGRHMTFLRELPGPCDPARPKIGLVSQSGGYGTHILHLAVKRGLQVSKFATTGNEADVEFGEVLALMAGDDDVDIIVGYIEGLSNSRTLIEGLRLARKSRKPVILMKVGATARGAAAAASHTAALAGADEVYDAVFRRYGAFRANSTEDVLDIAYALRAAPRGIDPKLGVITISGGAGVQIADFAEVNGLEMASPSERLRQQLHEAIPYASPHNPVDVTAQIGDHPALFARCIELMLEEGFNAFVIWLGPAVTNPKVTLPFLEAIRGVMARHPQAVLMVSMLASNNIDQDYEAAGCLLFEESERAVRALAAMRFFAGSFAQADEPEAKPARSVALPAAASLNEREAQLLLEQAGLGIAPSHVVADAAGAAKAAASLGQPVAVKVLSRDILHKTDVGGVALNLRTPDEAAAAVTQMLSSVPQAAPGAAIEGFLVTPMVGAGVDCIIGAHNDPTFGPIVMFGIGGVLVEIMKDVVFSPAPVSPAEARRMVTGIRGALLLQGYRGAPEADVDALVAALVSVSQLAAANSDRLKTIEINPLRVLPRGKGALVLDAVIETTGEGGRA